MVNMLDLEFSDSSLSLSGTCSLRKGPNQSSSTQDETQYKFSAYACFSLTGWHGSLFSQISNSALKSSHTNVLTCQQGDLPY